MRRLAIPLLFLFLVSQTGCWDRLEPSERLYALGITVEPVKMRSPSKLEPDLADGLKPKFLFTYEFSVVKELMTSGPIPGSGGGGGEQKPTWNIPVEAASVVASIHKLQTEAHRHLEFSHLKVMLIHEDVAKQGIQGVLNYFDRNPLTAPRVKILVFRDQKASKLLTSVPRIDKVSALNLALLTNVEYTAMKTNMCLERVSSLSRNPWAYLVPRVKSLHDRYNIGGAEIFKGYKMIGSLEEQELGILSFIINNPGQKFLEVEMDNDEIASCDVVHSKVRKKASMPYGRLNFDYELEVNVRVKEYIGKLQGSNVKDLEKRFSDYLERALDDVVAKAQTGVKADYLGVGEYLSKYRPSLWKKLEKDWPKKFREARIRAKVKDLSIQVEGEKIEAGI